jgi:hypothetical protein
VNDNDNFFVILFGGIFLVMIFVAGAMAYVAGEKYRAEAAKYSACKCHRSDQSWSAR